MKVLTIVYGIKKKLYSEKDNPFIAYRSIIETKLNQHFLKIFNIHVCLDDRVM